MKSILIAMLFVVIGVGSSIAVAAELVPYNEKTAFKSIVRLPANSFVVPTVVELPLPSNLRSGSYMVEQVSDQTLVPHYWYGASDAVPPKLYAWRDENSTLANKLVDGLLETSESFLVSRTGIGTANMSLALSPEKQISSLEFVLEKNVVLPERITIQYMDANNERLVALADTVMRSTVVTFPAITTDSLLITLTHSQPLRISEIRVGEENQVIKQTSGLRFLAQPNEAYVVYVEADRPVTLPRGEQRGLMNNEGVVRLPEVPFTQNYLYEPADQDDDDVLDTVDNCPSVKNTDQADIDQNGKGDACEDFDRDGVMNDVDNCPDLPNQDQADEDADGIGDSCDDEESRLTEKYAWILWVGLGLGFAILIFLFMIVLRHEPNISGQQPSE